MKIKLVQEYCIVATNRFSGIRECISSKMDYKTACNVKKQCVRGSWKRMHMHYIFFAVAKYPYESKIGKTYKEKNHGNNSKTKKREHR